MIQIESLTIRSRFISCLLIIFVQVNLLFRENFLMESGEVNDLQTTSNVTDCGLIWYSNGDPKHPIRNIIESDCENLDLLLNKKISHVKNNKLK